MIIIRIRIIRIIVIFILQRVSQSKTGFDFRCGTGSISVPPPLITETSSQSYVVTMTVRIDVFGGACLCKGFGGSLTVWQAGRVIAARWAMERDDRDFTQVTLHSSSPIREAKTG